MEPWDGPAAIAFTDGRIAGATLDRNGLRPARYYITRDGRLILSSEVGVLPLDEKEIVKKDRLRPGKMLLIDTVLGRVVDDGEIKGAVAAEYPYRRWVEENMINLADLPENGGEGKRWRDIMAEKRGAASASPRDQVLLKDFIGLEALFINTENAGSEPCALLEAEKIFGWTYEDINMTLRQMALRGEDPVSSMGADTPPAVLSERPQPLYNYFRQMFAQVTNPPIDSLRESDIFSSGVQFGSEGNLLTPAAGNCRMIYHSTPVLSDGELQKLRNIRESGFSAVTLPMLFNNRLRGGLKKALDDLFLAADIAIESGYNLLILSDRGAGENKIPIPALLAAAGMHHHLIRMKTRTRVSVIVESGEPREVHHFALLVGYGADAVNPYLAHRIIGSMAGKPAWEPDEKTALRNYRDGVTKGIIKTISKMGISTIRSYHGAQIFEALGISEEVVCEYFTGTITRIGGLTLKEIEQESRARHENAFEPSKRGAPLDPGGDFKWRRGGEYHLFNPENIYYLQQSCRNGDYAMFKKFTKNVGSRSDVLKNMRSMLNMVTLAKPIPLESVEPVENIVRRFKSGAMSYGSISPEAHECIAVAMNRLRAKSNSGEGGEHPERWLTPGPGGENRASAIKQVASGRFGVTISYLANAMEIQIKMAQGAKPGEGGHLPGNKVYPWIASARGSTPGVELISPPPHHDIYSIEDLAQLIHDLKNAKPGARISVKLVSEAGVGTIAVGVAKGLADVILISGCDGGTGAAPRSSIRHAGLPWELGLAEAHQTLLLNNLRNRVTLETDGKLLTGRDVVIAALLGAEEFGFATSLLVTLGCDMMRVCNLDTCPVGIATQNPELRKKFTGKPEYIENFMRFLAQEVREWMAKIGVRSFNGLIGHVELLRVKQHINNDKAGTLDLSSLLFQPYSVESKEERYFHVPQKHSLKKSLDKNTLIPLCRETFETGAKLSARLAIDNTQRAVGCMLSGEIAGRFGTGGLPDGTINLRFDGSAGQSFGAFLCKGVTLELHGDSNDHVGKGLSGARVVVMPHDGSKLDPGENVIIGNVAFYGATSGEAFIRSAAGERFCVRNSGITAVAEGAGDHACEYMTGGRVAILGPTGKNFGAGMSGGVAYIYDPENDLANRANAKLTGPAAVKKSDEAELREILEKHLKYTGSAKAESLLANFASEVKRFVKIMPGDYSKALGAAREAEKKGLPEEERALYAFNLVTAGKAEPAADEGR